MGCDSVVDLFQAPPESVNTLPTSSPATHAVVQESADNEPRALNAGPTLDHWSTIGAPFGSSVILSVRVELRTFFALTVTTYLIAFFVRFGGKIAGMTKVVSEHVEGKNLIVGTTESVQRVALSEAPVKVTTPPVDGTAVALAAKAVTKGAVDEAPAAAGSIEKVLTTTAVATT